MAIAKIILSCHVEPLWGRDRLFGINFNVIIDPIKGLSRSDLLTIMTLTDWRWDSVAIWDGTRRRIVPVRANIPHMSDVAGLGGAYLSFFSNSIGAVDPPAADFFTVPSGQIKDPTPRLPLITGDIMTRPASYQQNLRLSRYFEMPADVTDLSKVFVAPIFTSLPPRTAGAAPVANGPVALTGAFRVWSYEPSPVLDIDARIGPIQPAPAFLVKGTTWIQKQADFMYNPDPTGKAQLSTAIHEALNTAERMLTAVAGLESQFTQSEFTQALGHAMWVFQHQTASGATTLPVPTASFALRSAQIIQALQAEPATSSMASSQTSLSPSDVAVLKRHLRSGALASQLSLKVNGAQAMAPALVNGVAVAALTAAPAAPQAPPAGMPTVASAVSALAGSRQRPGAAFAGAVRQFHEASLRSHGVPTDEPRWQTLLTRIAPAAIAANSRPSAIPAAAAALPPGLFLPPFIPSPAPHTFAIPVSNGSTLNISDSATLISGYGVLVRVAASRGSISTGFRPWRCATLGRIFYRPSTDSVSTKLAVDVAMLPLRAKLMPGANSSAKELLQQTLYYDAQAMSVEGAGAYPRPTDYPQTQIQGASKGLTTQYPVPQYPIPQYEAIHPNDGHVVTNVEKWGAFLPGMKFGRIIQAAVFAVQNTGALPPGMSPDDNPGELQDYEASFAPPDAAIHSELYLRRVRIGLPEVLPGSLDPAALLHAVQLGSVVTPAPAIATPTPGAFDYVPFISASAGIAPIDPELDRDCLSTNDLQIYYGLPPERPLANDTNSGSSQQIPFAIGTLSLDAAEWTLAVDSIDLRALPAGSELDIQIEWNDSAPTDFTKPAGYDGFLLIRFCKSSSGVDFEVDYQNVTNGASIVKLGGGSQNLGLFDLRVDVSDTVCTVSAYKRDFLFSTGTARPAIALSTTALPVGIRTKGARIRLTTRGIGPVSYRRPMVAYSGRAAEAITKERPSLYIMAPPELEAIYTLRAQEAMHVPTMYRLNLRLPAIDVVTWDRWIEWKPEDLPARSKVWADFMLAGSNGTGATKLVDDPCVESIRIEATPVFGTANSVPVWLQATPGPAPSLFSRSQLNASVMLAVTGDGNPVTGALLTIKPGEIWELRAYNAVPANEFDLNTGRLHPRMQDDLRVADDCRILIGPVRIRVEAAALPSLPDDLSALESALLKVVVPSSNAGTLKVVLNRDNLTTDLQNIKIDPDAFWIRMKRFTLRAQEWRWLGRPVAQPPFPSISAPDADAQWKKWELSGAFNGRDPEDSRPLNTQVSFYGSLPVLLNEDIDSDPRALYMRYKLDIGARYAALGRTIKNLRLATPDEDWKAEIIPCRRQEKPPRPVVRLVIPLTQSAEISRNPDLKASPGVLVLVAERWFGTGGFNELFKAAVLPTSTEDWAAFPDMQEIGYDPLRDDGQTTLGSVQLPDPIGPIGHKLDLGVQTPLFHACSFIVNLPASNTDGRPIRAEWEPMARLQFWRELDGRGLYPAPRATIASDRTPPMNVQFLAETARFFGDMNPLQTWIELPSAGGVIFRDQQGGQMQKPPANTTLYAIVNRVIVDAFMMPQEELAGLYAQNPDNPSVFDSTVIIPSTAFDPARVYRARLIEVEVSKGDQSGRANESPAQQFWRKAFTEDGSDALIRIKGISEGVDSIPQKPTTEGTPA